MVFWFPWMFWDLFASQQNVIQQNTIFFLTKEKICFCLNVSVVTVSTEHLDAAAVTIAPFLVLRKHTDLCEEKYKAVCLMLSYWTVREILTRSIYNFRERYLQTSPFFENHAEFFFRSRIKGLFCRNVSSVCVGLLGRRSPGENVAQRNRVAYNKNLCF